MFVRVLRQEGGKADCVSGVTPDKSEVPDDPGWTVVQAEPQYEYDCLPVKTDPSENTEDRCVVAHRQKVAPSGNLFGMKLADRTSPSAVL